MNELAPRISRARLQVWLTALSFSGASVIVWPGIGDSIREPKWLWVWAFGILQAFFLSYARLKTVPAVVWIFLTYSLAQTLWFSSLALSYPFLLSLVSLFLLGICAATDDKIFTRVLLAVSILQLAFCVCQLFGFDPIFVRIEYLEANPLVGLLGQQTVLGAWVAPLAWFWAGRRNWFLFSLLTLLAFATGSALTGFAWVAALCAYGIWKRPSFAPWMLGGFFALALAALRYDQGYFSDTGRFRGWRFILSAALEKPWFGYGLDAFGRDFYRYQQGFEGPPWMQAHCEPLELFFGGGVVGLALGLALFYPLWARRQNWWGRAERFPWYLALTAVLANALGNFPLHIAPIALLAAISYFKLIAPQD